MLNLSSGLSIHRTRRYLLPFSWNSSSTYLSSSPIFTIVDESRHDEAGRALELFIVDVTKPSPWLSFDESQSGTKRMRFTACLTERFSVRVGPDSNFLSSNKPWLTNGSREMYISLQQLVVNFYLQFIPDTLRAYYLPRPRHQIAQSRSGMGMKAVSEGVAGL